MNNAKNSLFEIEIEINVELIPELIIDEIICFHCSEYGKYIH
ncbi:MULTISPECIES: hypothetical protein [Vibrio harveyi group]|nr:MULTISPECIES: hypothetical protein [Vibrio harveyi group]MDF5280166.1 hypothetical protein [Vibrio parahaemolyticus]WJT09537.1 hypothetical protein PH545_26390 [Vibrio harveyi]